MNLRRIITNYFRGTVYAQGSMKTYEMNDSCLSEKYGLRAEKIDYQSDIDLALWCSIINNAYDDCFFSVTTAREYLQNNAYFANPMTFVFYRIADNAAVATISCGAYKMNPKVGGDFRFAVQRDFQGNGYGRICLIYCYSHLANRGITLCETAIAFKRRVSLNAHYSIGLHPQVHYSHLTNKQVHPIKKMNLLLKMRQMRQYHYFLKQQGSKF